MASKRGIGLTRLEGEVMRSLWAIGPGPVRGRAVAEAVNAGRREPLAYTTVQTVLSILREKGVVEVVEGQGRGHLYRARLSREKATRHMLRDLADRLFGGPVRPLLHHLLDDAELDEAELRELRAWVDQRLRDSRGGAA